MKKILTTIVASCFLLLLGFGCKTEATSISNDNFTNDVKELAKFFTSNTRSETDSMTQEDIVALSETILDLFEKYNVEETVMESNFYKNSDRVATIVEDIDLDFYDFHTWVEDNGTQEFITTIDNVLINGMEPTSLDEMLNNNNLLPNEKVALTVLFSHLEANPIDDTQEANTSVAECTDQYRVAERGCNRTYAITLTVSVAGAYFSVGASLLGLYAAHLNHISCLQGAMESYDVCVKYAK